MAEDHGHNEGGGEDHGKGGGHKSHGSHGPGHGGGHEEHAGAPEWLISFADNVALLMGFFVILLAMNMAPKKASGGAPGEGPGGAQSELANMTHEEAQLIDLKAGILKAFHRYPKPDTKDPKEREFLADIKRLEEFRSKRPGVAGESKDKQSTPNANKVTPNLTVEFDEGSTLLSLQSKQAIRQIVRNELLGKDWVIDVRGHVSAGEAKAAERAALAADTTDESAFPATPDGGTGAGFDLSNKRALAVAAEMARCGIPWRHLRIVSCSDMARSVPRAEDPIAARKNQRVEIIQSQERVPPDPNGVEPGRPGH